MTDEEIKMNLESGDARPMGQPLPERVVVHDEPAAESADEPSNKTTYQHIKHPYGSAIRVTKCGRTIVGVIEETIAHANNADYPYAYYATVYEGDRIIFSIESCAYGLYFQRRVLKAAMYEAIMVMTHRIRNRENRKASAAERIDLLAAPAEPTAEELENA